MVRAVRWLVCASSLWGCVDPGAKLDAFHARELAGRRAAADAAQDAARPMADAGRLTLPSPEQVEGNYLYVVSTVLSPMKPIVSYLEVKAQRVDGGLELTMRDRPLSAMDRRTPVGEFGPSRTSLVAADGRYQSERLRIVTPGEADAVQPGVESESELVFSGTLPLVESDAAPTPLTFWCGQADGMLLRPIQQSLDGSTFTVTRIVDPEMYPAAVINCAMEPAVPL